MDEEGQFKRLVIRQVNDGEVEVCVAEQSTLRQVKEVLRKELNIPVCRQSFVGFDDDLTVVRDGTKLDLRVNLSGGCGVECCGCTWYGPCVKRECGGCEFFFPCSIM